MAITYNSHIIKDGLIFCMDAAAINGGSSAEDIVGSHTTTLVNDAAFNSADFGSIEFDGTDDYISTNLDASSFSSTNTEFTVDIWMDSDANNSSFALFNLNNGTGEYIEIRMNGTQYRITTRYNSITDTVTTIPFGGGSWQNLTCVKAPGLQDLYLNGEIETVGSPNTAQGDDLSFGAGGGVVIGCRGTPSSPAGTYWNGKISVVRVYDRALSSVEIRTNYDATKRRYL